MPPKNMPQPAPSQQQPEGSKPEVDVMQVHEQMKVEGLHIFFELAYKEAQKDFKHRIDMMDFSNRKDLQRDLARVKERLKDAGPVGRGAGGDTAIADRVLQ